MRIKEIFKKILLVILVLFVWYIIFLFIYGSLDLYVRLSIPDYLSFYKNPPDWYFRWQIILGRIAFIVASGVASFIGFKKFGKKFALFFFLLIIILIFRSFIFSPFTVGNEFLEPYLYKRENIIVQKINKAPQKGDIVITKSDNKNTPIISLVVGLPGDTIELKNGTLFVNGEPLENIVYNFEFSSGIAPITVPKGYFFGISTHYRYESPWDLLDLSLWLYKQSNIIGKIISPKRNIQIQKYTGPDTCNGYPPLSCPEGAKYYCPQKGKPFCCRGEVIEGYCRECPPGQDFAFSSDKKTKMCCEKELICNGICYLPCKPEEQFICDEENGAFCCSKEEALALSADRKTKMCCKKNSICNGLCYSECPKGTIFKCDPSKAGICE